MNNVNKTLYIPLYGKAYVSQKNIIIRDKTAEKIWQNEGFKLRGKAKSKWLAYYMGIRSAVFDEWTRQQLAALTDAVVIHIGCGMDSRVERVNIKGSRWYDIDFPEVIEERRRYFAEDDYYHMLGTDMRKDEWKQHIKADCDAVVVLEGVSMYFKPEELDSLLNGLCTHFRSLHILMDCYTEKAAKISKYKNPINDVGVTIVYGYDNPGELAKKNGLSFRKEYDMTPEKYIDELVGMEKKIFKKLFAGKISKAMYRMYEFYK